MKVLDQIPCIREIVETAWHWQKIHPGAFEK